jgi:hydroxymethylpyrimidine/phosphomethylpyrimidine kinase
MDWYCFCIAFYRRTIHIPKQWYCSSLAYLQEIVLALKGFRQKTRIVWDTVLKSSTEWRLSQYRKSNRFSKNIKKIDRFNYPKSYNYLQLKLMLKIPQNAISILCYFTKRRTSSRKIGIDRYFIKEIIRFTQNHRSQKTWFRLCFRLLLFLTLLENDLRTACYLAKDYIETYLQSN